jgi:hypothetical protein
MARWRYFMKIIISFILALCLAFVITSCNSRIHMNDSKSLAKAVLEDLTDDEESELADYFCDIVLMKTDDLNNQILNAEIFLKNVKPVINRTSVSGEEWIDYGQYTLISPFVYTEFTDSVNNEKYSMSIEMYLINAKHPEKEGISLITIKRMSDEEVINIGEIVY